MCMGVCAPAHNQVETTVIPDAGRSVLLLLYCSWCGVNADAAVVMTGQAACLPKVLAVNFDNGRLSRNKLVNQKSVDASSSGALVPTSVERKGRTVGERATPAHRAEMLRKQF